MTTDWNDIGARYGVPMGASIMGQVDTRTERERILAAEQARRVAMYDKYNLPTTANAWRVATLDQVEARLREAGELPEGAE